MPISDDFAGRLYSRLPLIQREFGTPVHVYDEAGIVLGARRLNSLFDSLPGGFREYFAVKALPNMRILEILRKEGFGFDCSSTPELVMADRVGAYGEDVMFTSNNTSQREYGAARQSHAILNLDDLSFVAKVPEPFPDLICFRYNPGASRQGNSFIGLPAEAKYGVNDSDIVEAYQNAIARGAKRFGLHTMVVSNERDYQEMIKTIKMLLGVVERLQNRLQIQIEFINIGGGIGIPYIPGEHQEFDLESLSKAARGLLYEFGVKHSYTPKLLMESGRWVTGPHGVLVTSVINRMQKYRRYVGVDASMSALMRPGMYGAYHHISVVQPDGKERIMYPANYEIVDVVGSLCENIDKFAVQRRLPFPQEGDFLIIQDTGAHGHAMGFNYNGRLRPAEVLLRTDGQIELIRREETAEDLFATQKVTPKIVS